MSRTAKGVLSLVALALLFVVLGVRCRRSFVSPARGVSPAASLPSAPRVARPNVTFARPTPVTLIPALAEPDDASPNGAVDGRVINWATSLGVTAAEITFSLDGLSAAVTTGDDGRFSFSPAKPGRLSIALVTAPGYLPFAPAWGTSPLDIVSRPRVRVRDVIVYLVPAIDYTAVVLTADGKPVAAATVTILGAAQGEQALAPIQDHFVTDGKGEAIFHAPDEALLEARHPAHGVGRARLSGPAQVSHRLEIRLGALFDGGAPSSEHLAGRVVDASGAPVEGARVAALPIDEEAGRGSLRGAADAVSDAAGRFTLAGLDPGLYTVSAAKEGFAAATAPKVPSGATDVVLALRRGGLLRGRVLTAAGEPVPSFTVIVSRREGPLKRRAVDIRSAIDADGRFEVADLEPETYVVRATAHAHAPSSEVDAVVPEPPAEGAPITLVVTDGARLTGKVIDAGGSPLARARVSIENIFGDATSAAPITVSAVTDERGDFELRGVPTGARSILFAAHRHHMRLLSGMVFVDGATVGPITVDLTPTKEGEQPRIELVGIGAVLVVDGDGLRVQEVIPGGGAEAAGMVAGDAILSIDGTNVTELGFDGSIQRIRGPEGSAVRLRVRRASGEVVDLTATRKRIRA